MEEQKTKKRMKKGVIVVLVLFLLIVIGAGTFFVTSYSMKNDVSIYNVSFDADGGTVVEAQKIVDGSKIIKPESPTKEGYVFAGWTYKGKLYDFSTVIDGDVVLKASWISEEEKIFTVKFDTAGGNSVDDQIVKEGEKAVVPAIPQKEGYEFVKWLLDGAEYKFDAVVNSDITLVAEWKKKEEKKEEVKKDTSSNNQVSKPSSNTSSPSSNNSSQTNNNYSGPILVANTTELRLKYGEKKDFYVTYNYGNGKMSAKIGNTNIISAAWGNWNGNTLNMTVTAKNAGETSIVITNTVNSEKITIKVIVEGPWKDVEIVIPETIGDDFSPGNRFKVTKYNFASYTSRYYKMYVTVKMVQYNETGRSSWGGDVYFYDANGNVLDDSIVYVATMALNQEYQDDLLVPINTAKIVFVEYPDPNAGKEEVDPTKWTSTDATNLNKYLSSASKYASGAVDYANKAYNAGALTVTYLNSSKSYLKVALSDLEQAKKLAESKATLNTTDGSTLLQEINNAIASCNQYEQLIIDQNNLEQSRSAIVDYAQNASLKILSPLKLSTDLLGQFV